jgi:predicted transposase YbfD/YdcC
MYYTANTEHSATQPQEFELSLQTLKQLFATIPEPRHGPNLRYDLASMLLAALLALLCNHLTELAIAEWLRDQPENFKQALGFSQGLTPHQTTFNRLFQKLKAATLERTLTAHLDRKRPGVLPGRGAQAVAIDGKAQRTRAKFAEEKGTPCHLLSLYLHQQGLVLAQTALDNKEAELTVAPALLAQLDWLGRVLTGDAIFCQRKICSYICEAGGDYFFAVRANQSRLEDDLRLLFEPPSPAEVNREGFQAPPPLEIAQDNEADKGHGRIEVRQLKVSSELAGYSDWPYLAQVVEIKRSWWVKSQLKEEVWLGVTSLPREVADLKRLLELKRGHWGIENKLHWVRDVVFGEDNSTLHKGEGPHILAILRNLALNILRLAGHSHISAVLRANSRHPDRAFTLLGVNA